MIPYLSDEEHERLWRICDKLVAEGGARAAILCDAENGSVVISVGDANAAGPVTSVESLGSGERLVHGAAGEIYGVDVPGGGLLAVLHDPPLLEQVRTAATEAVRNMANLLASLPPPPVPPPHVHAPEPARAQPKAKKKRKTTTVSKPRAGAKSTAKKPAKKKGANPGSTGAAKARTRRTRTATKTRRSGGTPKKRGIRKPARARNGRRRKK